MACLEFVGTGLTPLRTRTQPTDQARISNPALLRATIPLGTSPGMLADLRRVPPCTSPVPSTLCIPRSVPQYEAEAWITPPYPTKESFTGKEYRKSQLGAQVLPGCTTLKQQRTFTWRFAQSSMPWS